METTRLSTKGQVIIPKTFRAANRWEPGLELTVTDTGKGLLLRPKLPFNRSRLEEVAGMLSGKVKPKSEAQFRAALRDAIRKKWRGRG
jgi:AbrB family looped-hinge helix DNA binding protein